MMKTPLRALLFALIPLCLHGRAVTAPGYGDPLTSTVGTVHNVSSLVELTAALTQANQSSDPDTILVADGTYILDGGVLQITEDNLLIRSASGNRDEVVLRGPDEGPSASASHVFLISGSNVTVADVTLGYCRYHGIQIQGESPHDAAGLHVHNCRIVNCNEQFIKGSSSDTDPVGATDGIIENCLFEFTSGWAYQYYTGGIDIHKGVNWIVRDNLFRNIRNSGTGVAEHAVHFWKRCSTRPQNVIVERNWIINCDRGIGFGLSSLDGGHNGGTSVIRNNFVYNDGAGVNTDVCIGLEYADHIRVDNNTVYNGTYWAPIEYRFAGSTDLTFRNNLVNRVIQARDGAPAPTMLNNLESVEASWFRDLSSGDLHLVPNVSEVIDQGVSIPDFGDDFDGDARPQGGGWDIGADEYVQETANSDAQWLLCD